VAAALSLAVAPSKVKMDEASVKIEMEGFQDKSIAIAQLSDAEALSLKVRPARIRQ
jgi:hypothetical protein